MSDEMKKAADVMFEVGLKHRREVLGAEYVDGSLDAANDFMMAFQHITTEWCWATADRAKGCRARPAAC